MLLSIAVYECVSLLGELQVRLGSAIALITEMPLSWSLCCSGLGPCERTRAVCMGRTNPTLLTTEAATRAGTTPSLL